ncbi:MAG: dipeptidase [Acidobacteria bacterium]|nr:dipeptidase [Acidobacteriota bacterium]
MRDLWSAVPSAFALGLVVVLTVHCGPRPEQEDEVGRPEGSHQRADQLAHEFLLVDTHIDVPYRLAKGGDEDLSRRTEGGDFDYPRAIAGGLDVSFMSIYIPADYQETGGAKDYADSLIDLVESFEQRWPDKFRVISDPDAAESLPQGVVGLALGMENGAPIEGDLDNLRYFFDRGIRYITLTHSENNHICDSSYAKEKTWNGLSPFGREVVAEMNRLGMMIDISHLSDAAAEQVLELSEMPVIASHSSARKFTPGFERNMSDELIVELAENGGVIQINFGSAFLNEESNRTGLAAWAAAEEHAEENGLDSDGPEMEEWLKAYREENPLPLADLSEVVDHIEHVIEIAGIDHVGLGSDFDGVGPTLPEGLKDVSQFPNLIEALLERGHSEDDIRKICGGNLMRVWRAVETGAEAPASV